jgi:hypothetical protein
MWSQQRTDRDLVTREISPWATGRCSGGTCLTGGLSPSGPRTRALVSEADYIAAQHVNAASGPVPDGYPAALGRRYLLAGLLA